MNNFLSISKNIFFALCFTCMSVFQTSAQQALDIRFLNMVGKENVTLDTVKYTNASGEAFSISLLQYFITNIVLTDSKGNEFTVQQDSSYFLIKEADELSKTIHLSVPIGKYEKITFLLGVDSLRNTKPLSERKGCLDPASYQGAESMYWGWNSGYIFFKMEGLSPVAKADGAGNRKFRYHIGLFGGMKSPTISNIKKITLELNHGHAKANKRHGALILIKTDVSKMFEGSEMVKIAEHTTVMANPYSALIANNYANMFSHIRTQKLK